MIYMMNDILADLIGYYPRPKNSTGVKLLSGEALPTKETEEKASASVYRACNKC
jgi:hypothetical protein